MPPRRTAPRSPQEFETYADPERVIHLDGPVETEGDEPPGVPARRGGSLAAGLAVCLTCGQAPHGGAACDHPRVAVFDHASGAVHLAAKKLQELCTAQRQAERALLRLVERALERGEAELQAQPLSFLSPSPAAPDPEGLPAPAEAPPPAVPCPHCGRGAEAPRPAAPRRGRRHAEAQGLFSFASAPEPAPASPEDRPRVVPLADLEAPAPPAGRKRRRDTAGSVPQGTNVQSRGGSPGQLK
jgi:hypothetical protein